ncbi:DEKNAAC102846 [Brettanomyces naardenensis]|uniref:Mitochondrial inner membrane protease subunit n=1 Tax=Brettanomyces naardenensis TaxID=13370 RepID=A0A448YLW6_BRENA|nr:DEKNAAC102846 [Brettanomyces naardenensis]
MSAAFKFAKEGGRVVSYAVRAVAFLHLFSMNVYEFSSTSGDSMLPTLQVSNDYAIVDKRYKYGRNVKIGDVIVARKPNAPESWVCKRITGMAGDIILIDPSKGTLTGLDDDDWSEMKEIKTREEIEHSDNYNNYVIVPEGHCWVTGDNLTDSVDSRTYSVLPMGLISGKITHAWYIPHLWPIGDQYLRELENGYKPEHPTERNQGR